jgi:hypothetical protein
MFNYRIVVANKDLFNSIFKSVGKDYNNYKEIVNKYSSVFKPIAAWMLARHSDEFAINDIVSHLTEYINIRKLNPANIKVSKSFVVINDNQLNDSFISETIQKDKELNNQNEHVEAFHLEGHHHLEEDHHHYNKAEENNG